MRLGIVSMIQNAVGEVRLQRPPMLGETLEGCLQALQGKRLAGRFAQCGGAGNGFVQRVSHGATRAEHGERGRPQRMAKPGGLQLGIAIDGVIDALRAVIEHLTRAPAADASQRPALQIRQYLARAIQADRGRPRAGGQCPVTGAEHGGAAHCRAFEQGTSTYELLKTGQMMVDGIPVLSPTCLIPFKAKAWLDLKERKLNGEQVDSKNIKKHKNDVFRLAQLITANTRQVLSPEIAEDMKKFLSEIADETVDLKSLGIRGTDKQKIIDMLYLCYNLNDNT